MKNLVLALALVVSVQSYAAQVETCISKITSACGLGGGISAILNSRTLDRKEECKIVEDRRERVNNVVFRDTNDILAYNLNTCKLTAAKTYGKIVDTVIRKGRLFIATSRNRVIAVGRNGSIYEFNNSKNKSYSDVVGVKDGGSELSGVILLRERNQKTSLTDDQIDKRILGKRNITCIDGCSN